MKKVRANKEAHTSNSKVGMGDFYGSGVRNPMARSIDIFGMENLPKKKIKKAPKSLA